MTDGTSRDSSATVLLALDVQYDDEASVGLAGAVVFGAWDAEHAIATLRYRHHPVAPYVPGQFVKRELPCILPLVQRVRERFCLRTIVIDGFVDLGRDRPGLGRHLFESVSAVDPDVEVVGVSKSNFAGAAGLAVTRGGSARPLWVTSTSDARRAAACIASMTGEYRIPRLLKLADALARGLVPADEELAPA